MTNDKIGWLEFSKLLLERGADSNHRGKFGNEGETSPLWWAAQIVQRNAPYGLKLAKLLIEHGADVDDSENQAHVKPLWWAAWAVAVGTDKGLELAKLLLEKGASVSVNAVGKWDVEKCTPLWWAACAVMRGKAGGLELAKLLVEKGAAVNSVGACKASSGTSEALTLKGTPLMLAAWAVKFEKECAHDLTRLLVSKGAKLADEEKARLVNSLHV